MFVLFTKRSDRPNIPGARIAVQAQAVLYAMQLPGTPVYTRLNLIAFATTQSTQIEVEGDLNEILDILDGKSRNRD